MFKTILEIAISAFIVLGSLAVAYIMYNGLHAAVTNPSVPHGVLWQTLFGR